MGYDMRGQAQARFRNEKMLRVLRQGCLTMRIYNFIEKWAPHIAVSLPVLGVLLILFALIAVALNHENTVMRVVCDIFTSPWSKSASINSRGTFWRIAGKPFSRRMLPGEVCYKEAKDLRDE